MSDEDYVDKHLKRLVEKGPDTLASLRAEVERLTLGRETMGNLWAREKENSSALRAENEKLRAALKQARPFIGWAGHYPTILAEIDAALEEKQ